MSFEDERMLLRKRRTRSRSPPPHRPPAADFSKVYSIDVECVAVARTHELSSRAPCSVALVNSAGKVLYKAIIKPSQPVVSYLTALTGLTEGDLDEGVALEAATLRVKELLPQDATLVGQNPDSDVTWMELTRGVDFADVVDIGGFFKGYNSRHGNYSVHSLQHEARVLLGKSPALQSHDPAWDAQVSVELYKKAKLATQSELRDMQQRLIALPPLPSVAKRHNYNIDGVCMAKFMRKFCSCGKPCQ